MCKNSHPHQLATKEELLYITKKNYESQKESIAKIMEVYKNRSSSGSVEMLEYPFEIVSKDDSSNKKNVEINSSLHISKTDEEPHQMSTSTVNDINNFNKMFSAYLEKKKKNSIQQIVGKEKDSEEEGELLKRKEEYETNESLRKKTDPDMQTKGFEEFNEYLFKENDSKFERFMKDYNEEIGKSELSYRTLERNSWSNYFNESLEKNEEDLLNIRELEDSRRKKNGNKELPDRKKSEQRVQTNSVLTQIENEETDKSKDEEENEKCIKKNGYESNYSRSSSNNHEENTNSGCGKKQMEKNGCKNENEFEKKDSNDLKLMNCKTEPSSYSSNNGIKENTEGFLNYLNMLKEYERVCNLNIVSETEEKEIHQKKNVSNTSNSSINNSNHRNTSNSSNISNKRISTETSEATIEIFKKHNIDISNISKHLNFNFVEDEVHESEGAESLYCNNLKKENVNYEERKQNGKEYSGENNFKEEPNNRIHLKFMKVGCSNKDGQVQKENKTNFSDDDINLHLINRNNYLTNEVMHYLLSVKEDKLSKEEFTNCFMDINFELKRSEILLIYKCIQEFREKKKEYKKDCQKKKTSNDESFTSNMENKEKESNNSKDYVSINDIKEYFISRNEVNHGYYNELLKMIIHFNNIMLLQSNKTNMESQDRVIYSMLGLKFAGIFKELLPIKNDFENLIKHLNQIMKSILRNNSKEKRMRDIIEQYLQERGILIHRNFILSQMNEKKLFPDFVSLERSFSGSKEKETQTEETSNVSEATEESITYKVYTDNKDPTPPLMEHTEKEKEMNPYINNTKNEITNLKNATKDLNKSNHGKFSEPKEERIPSTYTMKSNENESDIIKESIEIQNLRDSKEKKKDLSEKQRESNETSKTQINKKNITHLKKEKVEKCKEMDCIPSMEQKTIGCLKSVESSKKNKINKKGTEVKKKMQTQKKDSIRSNEKNDNCNVPDKEKCLNNSPQKMDEMKTDKDKKEYAHKVRKDNANFCKNLSNSIAMLYLKHSVSSDSNNINNSLKNPYFIEFQKFINEVYQNGFMQFLANSKKKQLNEIDEGDATAEDNEVYRQMFVKNYNVPYIAQKYEEIIINHMMNEKTPYQNKLVASTNMLGISQNKQENIDNINLQQNVYSNIQSTNNSEVTTNRIPFATIPINSVNPIQNISYDQHYNGVGSKPKVPFVSNLLNNNMLQQNSMTINTEKKNGNNRNLACTASNNNQNNFVTDDYVNNITGVNNSFSTRHPIFHSKDGPNLVDREQLIYQYNSNTNTNNTNMQTLNAMNSLHPMNIISNDLKRKTNTLDYRMNYMNPENICKEIQNYSKALQKENSLNLQSEQSFSKIMKPESMFAKKEIRNESSRGGSAVSREEEEEEEGNQSPYARLTKMFSNKLKKFAFKNNVSNSAISKKESSHPTIYREEKAPNSSLIMSKQDIFKTVEGVPLNSIDKEDHSKKSDIKNPNELNNIHPLWNIEYLNQQISAKENRTLYNKNVKNVENSKHVTSCKNPIDAVDYLNNTLSAYKMNVDISQGLENPPNSINYVNKLVRPDPTQNNKNRISKNTHIQEIPTSLNRKRSTMNSSEFYKIRASHISNLKQDEYNKAMNHQKFTFAKSTKQERKTFAIDLNPPMKDQTRVYPSNIKRNAFQMPHDNVSNVQHTSQPLYQKSIGTYNLGKENHGNANLKNCSFVPLPQRDVLNIPHDTNQYINNNCNNNNNNNNHRIHIGNGIIKPIMVNSSLQMHSINHKTKINDKRNLIPMINEMEYQNKLKPTKSLYMYDNKYSINIPSTRNDPMTNHAFPSMNMNMVPQGMTNHALAHLYNINEENLDINELMKIPGVKLGNQYIKDINICSDWLKENNYDQQAVEQSIKMKILQNNNNNNNNQFNLGSMSFDPMQYLNGQNMGSVKSMKS